ncbi:MAG TPA: tRNA (adenosine(37)-N6)-threonylcarbamoyltransferase complex ATPase subunit type 1 TsaE [Flavobacteriaceae bacterium]|nr:tRNA (adenosine(37)-N6)-threonylcarbamoyltransferase complex ATPase subunit type 1 TsaE [Flavobacteriaceae bacterium]MCB9213375.1 tRNA (adenosine(37)-N6)-threonylcarbamoyltransferase complex ATPase subunit type 1 TsaE [Alteromonas sp.]HPF10267.1 tRNA (adenosine(37)-N6)-threonylcarbamoyltransferase complex ATPase subunit type 1 TsaE [Flavobacteriaceae bacterium]HQU20713.1 tRNA (adenosine(37)-N6)-threonylcarbamoyltransferase complex ATPase subunit type 1 TsaE [Flavobacteriaceae bacterium]HQU64
MEKTYDINNLSEIATLVLENTSSKTLLFYGDMGVGKTTLIKELVKCMGAEDKASSPSFSIVNEYVLDQDKLYHFDFYRIQTEEEALDIGIEDYLDAGHWNMIEWPEKIKNLLPSENTTIQLTKNQNGTRTIMIMPMK